MVRGIAIADLHVGIDNVGGLNENGLPARVVDFIHNLDLVGYEAMSRKVDMLAIIGDLFKSRNPPQRVLQPVFEILSNVANAGIRILLVRGNHDGDSEPDRPNVLDTAALLHENISVFNQPCCQSLWFADPAEGGAKSLNILAVPWPRLKWALGAEGAGMDYAEMLQAANAGLVQRMNRLVDVRDPVLPTLLLGHLAVLGADRSSEQWMTLGWEPTISIGDIPPQVNLALFGHYHKGSTMAGEPRVAHALADEQIAAYCGSIAKIDFGEEGQEKYWWEFEFGGPSGKEVRLEPHLLPDRPFKTIEATFDPGYPADGIDVAIQTTILNVVCKDAVIRLRLNFGTSEQEAAFSEARTEELLRAAGAWWIAGIERKAPRAIRRTDFGDGVSTMDDPALLMHYLGAQDLPEAEKGRAWQAGVGVMEGRPALDRDG